MAEFRHSSSTATPRATASSVSSSASPIKRDEVTSPFSTENIPLNEDDDGNDRHHHPRDRAIRSLLSSHLASSFPFLHFPDSSVRLPPYNSRISLFVLFLVLLAGGFLVSSVVTRLNAPYLCKKDGIVLHCPQVKDAPSLWENPYSATTSWKPCAERRGFKLSSGMLL